MVKNLPVMQEIWVLSLGQEDLLEKRNGCPLQYSCLENSMDREACQATVHGITKSLTRLSDLGFPSDSVVENLPAATEDMGLITGLRRYPGDGNDNPLQYSCLGNPIDRGYWQAIVCGVTKELDMTEQLNSSNSS